LSQRSSSQIMAVQAGALGRDRVHGGVFLATRWYTGHETTCAPGR
jgi:hypothetical protein